MSARDDYPFPAAVADGRINGGVYGQRETGDALDEIDTLRRWKREATIVLGYWDDAFELSGVEGRLGDSKPTLMCNEILRLRGEVAGLRKATP